VLQMLQPSVDVRSIGAKCRNKSDCGSATALWWLARARPRGRLTTEAALTLHYALKRSTLRALRCRKCV
jgi:hypothetical protein